MKNDYLVQDTIAGISTALSEAGIGIVRVSGEYAMEIADRIFFPGDHRGNLSSSPANVMHYGFIQDDGEKIDEVLVCVMRAPHSFTAENTVEINCHGGVYAVRRVLETVLKNGARLAQPGEFTRRAFLNGRIDLSQAEAVMDMIQSSNELALRSSLSQLQGSVHKKIREVREKILYELAFIEAALDDPEHYSTAGYSSRLLENTLKWMEELKKLIDSADCGRYIREGIRTVIAGKPNVGKSSLLNCLMGEERAIVTEMAGTTRDILTEQIQIGNVTLTLTDTAGIHPTNDKVEKIGVERACASVSEADLVLFVVDSSDIFDENDRKVAKLVKGKNTICLLNKTDLVSITDEQILKKELGEDSCIISVSAKEGEGIQTLENTITDRFFHGQLSFNDEIIVTNMRHKLLLEEAQQALFHLKEAIKDGLPEDFLSIDLTDACAALGEITGDEIREDLVNEIFGKFCMGK